MSTVLDQKEAFSRLPAPWATDLLPEIRERIPKNCRKLWILDDDPTGTQTIADLPVITDWEVPTLQKEFDVDVPACFILTNSRGLTADQTQELHQQLMRNLREAAGQRSYGVISRSDSTLRGHYPLETDTIAQGMTCSTITLLAPFFAAGGRYTLNNTHYVAEADKLIPAGETPFARDAVFGYRASHLPTWVEEKTKRRITASNVIYLPLPLIRGEGPAGVTRLLTEALPGSVVVANAVEQSDIEVVVAGVMAAETRERRIIARVAASYVCARVGQRPPPLLDGNTLTHPDRRGGLTLVGSHVPKTTTQLEQLQRTHDVVSIELDVASLLNPQTRDATIERASTAMNEALAADRDTVVHTSRKLVRQTDDSGNLSISAEVSRALIEVVRNIVLPPRYLIAKGGITSSDIATQGLGVKRAIVAGQILPGVPVWRLGPETKFPGLSYVVFPGNVGDDNAVADAVAKFNTSSP